MGMRNAIELNRITNLRKPKDFFIHCVLYLHLTLSLSLFSFSLQPHTYIEYDHIQLSELEIVGTLGVGGFGRVELVQYNKKETFALKILKKCEVASQGQIEHAYSEKDIMSSCDSPFIVK